MSVFDTWFRSKKQHDEDVANYYAWAYPYGEAQKNKIDEIIKELIPEEDHKIAIYNYLVCRQAMCTNNYQGIYVINDDQYVNIYKQLYKQYTGRSKNAVHKYMSLAEFDLKIDENLNYPLFNQIVDRANAIKAIVD